MAVFLNKKPTFGPVLIVWYYFLIGNPWIFYNVLSIMLLNCPVWAFPNVIWEFMSIMAVTDLIQITEGLIYSGGHSPDLLFVWGRRIT